MAGFTSAQVEDGIVKYLDNELMPLLPETGFQKVLAGTAVALVLRKYSGKLDEIKQMPIMKTLGVVNEDGTFDVMVLSEELKKQIPKEGMSVEAPVIGTLTFKSGDVDKLVEYIKQSR